MLNQKDRRSNNAASQNIVPKVVTSPPETNNDDVVFLEDSETQVLLLPSRNDEDVNAQDVSDHEDEYMQSQVLVVQESQVVLEDSETQIANATGETRLLNTQTQEEINNWMNSA